MFKVGKCIIWIRKCALAAMPAAVGFRGPIFDLAPAGEARRDPTSSFYWNAHGLAITFPISLTYLVLRCKPSFLTLCTAAVWAPCPMYWAIQCSRCSKNLEAILGGLCRVCITSRRCSAQLRRTSSRKAVPSLLDFLCRRLKRRMELHVCISRLPEIATSCPSFVGCWRTCYRRKIPANRCG